MKKLTYLLLMAAFSANVQAQPFFTYEHIDINNFDQRIMVHGDMWWDIVTSDAKSEYPKGSGKNALFAGAIWMAGYDDQAQLHVASQTYRQTGNDYWPGPLDANGSLSLATSTDWARIWKVNKTTIDSFKLTPAPTLSNTPASILEWPAIGNPYAKGANGVSLNITTPMAPFIDSDKDGKYDPLKGDYPAIKGDQMLWWVFSDNGPTHNHSNTQPLQVEVHGCAYGYKQNSLIDNVVYYEYNITNRSNNDYQGFRLGIWTDAELGYHLDDYVGFDSTRRLGYVYNASSIDGMGAPDHYGNNMPMAGITIIKSPNDVPGMPEPVGSFMYYNNDNSMPNPPTAVHYNNFLRATWPDGTHLKYGGNGYNTNGPQVNYVYSGDPMINTQWSECALNNTPGNRRFVIATGDYNFKKGTTMHYAIAAIATPPALNNGCPNMTTTTIKEVADTARTHFGDPVSVPDIAAHKTLKIYPNPVSEKLYIEAGNENGEILVYNAIGSKCKVQPVHTGGKTEIDVSHLAPGVYNMIYRKSSTALVNTFIKD